MRKKRYWVDQDANLRLDLDGEDSRWGPMMGRRVTLSDDELASSIRTQAARLMHHVVRSNPHLFVPNQRLWQLWDWFLGHNSRNCG